MTIAEEHEMHGLAQTLANLTREQGWEAGRHAAIGTILEQLAEYYAAGLEERSVRPEVCVCAAARLDDGRVIRGHRHSDCVQTMKRWHEAGQTARLATSNSQGFMTTRNRYVGRAEAYALHLAAGLIPPHRQGSSLLTSEDL